MTRNEIALALHLARVAGLPVVDDIFDLEDFRRPFVMAIAPIPHYYPNGHIVMPLQRPWEFWAPQRELSQAMRCVHGWETDSRKMVLNANSICVWIDGARWELAFGRTIRDVDTIDQAAYICRVLGDVTGFEEGAKT